MVESEAVREKQNPEAPAGREVRSNAEPLVLIGPNGERAEVPMVEVKGFKMNLDGREIFVRVFEEAGSNLAGGAK